MTVARRRTPDGPKVAVLFVYLPPKLLRRLKRIAEAERRPVSGQARVYLERAMEAQDA